MNDFEPLFTPEAVSLILRNEAAKHRMVTAAYGVILARSKAELIDYLRNDPAKAAQAPELLSWLLKHGKGDTPQSELLSGAALRLGIALNELGLLPVVH
jgi:hypothetical protein